MTTFGIPWRRLSLAWLLLAAGAGAQESETRRVTLAQIRVTNDVKKNLESIRSAFAKAAEDKAHLIQFPEGALSGYRGSFDQAEVSAAFEEVRALSKKHGIVCLLGTCWKEEGKTTNEVRVIGADGELAARYAKRCLTYGDAKDYSPGTTALVHTVAGLTVGILICNDLWVTPGYTDGPNPHLTNQMAKAGAQAIFHSVNSGSDQRYREYHESNLKLRAAEAKCPIVVVNAAQDKPVNCASGIVRPFEYAEDLGRAGEVVKTLEFKPAGKR